MLDNLKNKLFYLINGENKPKNKSQSTPLSMSLDENMITVKKLFPQSMDLNTKEMLLGKTKINVLTIEGLVSTENLTLSLIMPLLSLKDEKTDFKIITDFVRYKSIISVEQKELYDFETLFTKLMSGFAILLVDGVNIAFAFGLQGYKHRGIDDSENETNEFGSKEAFVEPVRVNLSMVRRRVKSPDLKFELMNVGNQSKTDICLVYMTDRASDKLLRILRKKISSIDIDMVLDSSYVRPYIENHPFSLFSSVGYTERPDVLCGKINEGRVAILVDGSPFALIVPYLFSENFKSFDDYAHRPYFATFVRIIKYLSFYVSFLLPGSFVAAVTFHPSLIPHSLLFSIASAEQSIPFSLMLETLFIYLVFEIMREAGIRLPGAVGHTIGIVGALVIGDAAVNAGLVGAPMVMVVAITAICAFTIPQLYEPIMLLRFVFIIVGGFSGLFGIALGSAVVSAIICSMNSIHIPMTAPVSPFDARWMIDGTLFAGIRRLSKSKLKIQNITGSEIGDTEERKND